MKKSISDSAILEAHNELWAEAEKEHKLAIRVPSHQAQEISDFIRGLYVLQIWKKDGQKGSAIKFLLSYSIPESTVAKIADQYLGIDVDEDSVVEEIKTEKRADKWDAFLKWAKDKVFEQFTTEQLVEISGFSYPTTLKFVQENPTFRKVKRGLWEIRDPKADREAEKS